MLMFSSSLHTKIRWLLYPEVQLCSPWYLVHFASIIRISRKMWVAWKKSKFSLPLQGVAKPDTGTVTGTSLTMVDSQTNKIP